MSGIWSAYKGMTTYCNIRNMGRNFFASVDDGGNLRLWVTNTQSGKPRFRVQTPRRVDIQALASLLS